MRETLRDVYKGIIERFRGERRATVAPTEHPDERDPATHGVDYRHPAYATISASRVRGGGGVLFDSDFRHSGYIRISIQPATLRRNLAQDWIHGSLDEYVEVALTEAQWATFVSSLNIGSGTPCTLTGLDGCAVPGIPGRPDRAGQFKAEATERLARARESLRALAADVERSALSQKAKADFGKRIDGVLLNLEANFQFVADQFGEHMETTVEKAKVEIHAHAAATLQRLGLEALRGQLGPGATVEPAVALLPPAGEDERGGGS